MRYRIVLLADQGWSGNRISGAVGCCASTVSRTLDRWELYGHAGLIDRREENGELKADLLYEQTVRWILEGTPQDFFHHRPTWTQRLLIDVAKQYTGVTVSKTTMGRLLKKMKVRRGRPKPQAPCPWSKIARKRRVAMLHGLLGTLPESEAAVWEDEADIDLNPRIGFDWTLPGTQRRIMTPGKNQKTYLAGAMDAGTDRVTWVRGDRKTSRLFIDLLKKLLNVYADKEAIHVILDNYTIHSSKQTRAWLAEFGSKFRLHFLPPYCPDDNRIERKLWRELHANVTVNHRCQTMTDLMHEVVYYLNGHNRKTRLEVRELREAI